MPWVFDLRLRPVVVMFLSLGFQQGAVVGAQDVAMVNDAEYTAIIGRFNNRQMLLARDIHDRQNGFQRVADQGCGGLGVGDIAGVDKTVQRVVEGDVFQIRKGQGADQFIAAIDDDKGAVGKTGEHGFDFRD